MPGACKTSFLLFIGLVALQDPPAGSKPPAPPVETLPFALVKPDASVELIGATGVATTGSAVWVLRGPSGTLARVDPATNGVVRHVAVGVDPCGTTASGLASLWVPLCGERGVARVDDTKNALTSVTLLGPSGPGSSVAVGVGSLWLFPGDDGTLLRIDPDTRKAVAEIYLPKGSRVVAFDADAIWTAGADTGVVTRIDPHTNLIAETIKVGKMPAAIAIGEGAVWVLNAGDGTVSRIDPKANRVTATIDVGKASGAGAMVAAEGSVWISAPGAPLTRIDPKTNRVAQQFAGEDGGPIAAGHRSLWMLVRPGVVWRVDPRFVEALRRS